VGLNGQKPGNPESGCVTPKIRHVYAFDPVAEIGGFDAGGWGDYANAVAGKIGAVLFAGCVAGVEGKGKDK
jgi:hypothetical protein